MRILVVDDLENIRESLEWLIHENGDKAITCGSGEQAISFLAADKFDAMFLDIKLPHKSGLDVLKEIRHLLPKLKVIMISGHADLSTAVTATKLGAYDFLEKPLNPEKVLLVLKQLKERRSLEDQFSQLKELVQVEYQMVGDSPELVRLRSEIDLAAPSDSRILIQGENGTGKELAAREIHQKSARHDKPFVKLNCAAIPKELIESELFGHERGAFTGAVNAKSACLKKQKAERCCWMKSGTWH